MRQNPDCRPAVRAIMKWMVLGTHPRLRLVAAFVPALVLIAVVVSAIVANAWGLWATSLLIGGAWFAVWAPIQVLNPSERALRWLRITALAGVLAGALVLVVYVAR
jgi:hypothetical protein